MVGFENTKEAIAAVIDLTDLIYDRLADGASVDDAVEIFKALSTDPELKAKIEAAWDKKEQIPSELKDLNLLEGAQIAMQLLEGVKKIVKTDAEEAE